MPSTSWLLRDMGIRQAVQGLRGSSGARDCEETAPETAPLSDGEIHFLWWFIQGAIMEVETRWKLRRAWGLCGRHAWGALATEAAFRHSYLHGARGPLDLMECALRAFQVRGALQARRLARRLRATGPCLMCELHVARRSRAAARAELIVEERDPSQFQSFAAETRRFW